MNASIYMFRNGSRPETWMFSDGKDVVHVYLDKDGIHTQRFINIAPGQFRICEKQSMSFSKLIDRSEGQLGL